MTFSRGRGRGARRTNPRATRTGRGGYPPGGPGRHPGREGRPVSPLQRACNEQLAVETALHTIPAVVSPSGSGAATPVRSGETPKLVVGSVPRGPTLQRGLLHTGIPGMCAGGRALLLPVVQDCERCAERSPPIARLPTALNLGLTRVGNLTKFLKGKLREGELPSQAWVPQVVTPTSATSDEARRRPGTAHITSGRQPLAADSHLRRVANLAGSRGGSCDELDPSYRVCGSRLRTRGVVTHLLERLGRSAACGGGQTSHETYARRALGQLASTLAAEVKVQGVYQAETQPKRSATAATHESAPASRRVAVLVCEVKGNQVMVCLELLARLWAYAALRPRTVGLIDSLRARAHTWCELEGLDVCTTAQVLVGTLAMAFRGSPYDERAYPLLGGGATALTTEAMAALAAGRPTAPKAPWAGWLRPVFSRWAPRDADWVATFPRV